MNEIENGNLPAFARSYSERTSETYPDALSAWSQVGLTKREYFAAKALQGMLANPEIMKDARNFPIMTDSILSIVDELLTQLSKQQ